MSVSNVSATAALLQAIKRAHRTLRKSGFDMTEIDAAIAKGEEEVPIASSVSPSELTSLANDLDTGVGADIWFDAAHPDDESARSTIETTQNAMNQAAGILRALAK